ncbi:MAG TPA: GAF domain-containing protein [Micromonosporaceae bacterium]|nr:GAF domain-containing protein [Micromonosporaceae bacterium]
MTSDRLQPGRGASTDPEDEPQVLAPGGFPYVARMELDELLEQLIARARDVQQTQGRLRGLLRASRTVAAAVDLDEVLQHILEAARTLVNARYAAIGLVEQGRLVRFLYLGIDDEVAAAIGHLPEGKGLLGRLIDYPEPLRVPDIGSHMASVGFPNNHPEMRSFLGVPIQVGGRLYGNLYLADKQGNAEFSRDDEELVIALAATAGAAISNAALFAQSGRRQRWHAAMADLSTAVLTTDDADQALVTIMQRASQVAGCTGAAVGVPAEVAGHVRIATAEGAFADQIDAVSAVDGTIYGQAMVDRRTVVVSDLSTDPRTAERASPGVGATVAIPMLTELSADGVLFLCRAVGDPQFEAVDLEMLAAYAAHAALVLQLARSRRESEELRVADDRLHIAEQLRRDVLVRISRLSMDLAALAARTHDQALRDGLNARIADTDQVMKALRDAVFALQESAPANS